MNGQPIIHLLSLLEGTNIYLHLCWTMDPWCMISLQATAVSLLMSAHVYGETRRHWWYISRVWLDFSALAQRSELC